MMMLILTMMVIAMILVIVSDGCNQLNMTLESGEKSKEFNQPLSKVIRDSLTVTVSLLEVTPTVWTVDH